MSDDAPPVGDPAVGDTKGDPPDIDAELTALYARVDAVLADARPRCEMSGRCCDFPNTDHELWSSALELAYARRHAPGAAPAEASGGATDLSPVSSAVPPAPSGQCPWYVEGTCRNREGRPLGCRLYFCDPAWAPAMPQVYERFHEELKALHEAAGVPYGYHRFVDAVRD